MALDNKVGGITNEVLELVQRGSKSKRPGQNMNKPPLLPPSGKGQKIPGGTLTSDAAFLK